MQLSDQNLSKLIHMISDVAEDLRKKNQLQCALKVFMIRKELLLLLDQESNQKEED